MQVSEKIFDATALIIIFLLTTANILVLSYNTANGYISPDSANYLGLAERILSGHGLFVSTDGRTENLRFYLLCGLLVIRRLLHFLLGA